MSDRILEALYLFIVGVGEVSNLGLRGRISVIKDLTGCSYEDYSEYISLASERLLGDEEYLLMSWRLKLLERDRFINSLGYGEGTYKLLEDLLGNSLGIWKGYFQVKKMLEDRGEVLGDRPESLIEEVVSGKEDRQQG